MKLRLYDTYQRRLREFKPLRADAVRLYACGPTVYDYAHLGNLRTYIFEDILRRALEFFNYRVTHVINITDVGHLTSDADRGEDKMEQGARRTGKSAWEIAAQYTAAFKDDIARLNIRPPDIWCRATDHIAEQIAAIQQMEARGFVYRIADGMYFDTGKLTDYGYLARLDRAGLRAGARVAMGEKKQATDFALWKFSVAGTRQMEWNSPWGNGFPGWHIECSAMAVKYLGEYFDIHCGGKDHIPIHHTNEIAQAQACHDTRLANFWLHGYFLQTDAAASTAATPGGSAKMSKSSGDFLRLKTLAARGFSPLDFRYLCLTAHYRADLKFTWESLTGAAAALERLRTAAAAWEDGGRADAHTVTEFANCIGDDLNTAKGLAVVWKLAKSILPAAVKKATLVKLDEVLGLDLARAQSPLEVASEIKISSEVSVAAKLDDPAATFVDLAEDEIQQLLPLLADRSQARENRDWAAADRLRDAISALGFELEDTPEGARIRKRKKRKME